MLRTPLSSSAAPDSVASDPAFAGLDWLEHPVFALNPDDRVCFANAAAEQMLALSRRSLCSRPLPAWFGEGQDALRHTLEMARQHGATYREYDLQLTVLPNQMPLHVTAQAIPLDRRSAGTAADVLLELQPLDPQLRVAHEEQMARQQEANRELMRNLAHEIKNPLGGIRGAAQLLEHELADPSLREYTEVIRGEADRLQALLDRLLMPNPRPQLAPLNIHEVLERVRQLVSAETQRRVRFRCDYDTSLPEIVADRGQLIQVVLNIVKNAVQALGGEGEIELRTRVARQVTLSRKRYPLALKVDIIDHGPGIPTHLQPHIFYPLVTGRPDGTGLGLSLALAIVQQHHGALDFTSRPGCTEFSIQLPVLPAGSNGQ